MLLLACVGVVRAVDSKPLTDQQFEQLRGKVQAKLDDLRAAADFPGVTVGFVLADGRSAGVSSGFADAAKKVPLKPDDRMLAGSIGKTYVAAVVLQLVEEGKIGLDDKLEKWLGKEPWYPRLPNGPDLTIRHLLNHTAGLPEYFEAKGVTAAVKADPDRVWKPEELVAYVLDAKPLFAAGKGYAYADTDYILVGMAAEKAGGKPLFAEVERRLLKPLKLDKTTPSDKRVIPGLVCGHAAVRNPLGYEGGRQVRGEPADRVRRRRAGLDAGRPGAVGEGGVRGEGVPEEGDADGHADRGGDGRGAGWRQGDEVRTGGDDPRVRVGAELRPRRVVPRLPVRGGIFRRPQGGDRRAVQHRRRAGAQEGAAGVHRRRGKAGDRGEVTSPHPIIDAIQVWPVPPQRQV